MPGRSGPGRSEPLRLLTGLGRGRRTVWLCGLAASIPILAAAIHSAVSQWTPLGDDAFVAVRAFDVLSGHSPLIGQWSSGATEVTGMTTYSPGPMLFWLLALPARLPEAALLPLTCALVNVACVIGTVLLARRRGGTGFAVVVALVIPIMFASLPADVYTDVWNSSVGLAPLVLLAFLTWSVCAGELSLLPVSVLVASFLAQAHLAYVGPVTLLGVLFLGSALLTLMRRPRPPHTGVWLVTATAVGVVCWAAPVYQQLTHSPGNLRLILDSATAGIPRLGSGAGWRAVVHTVGLPPLWLSHPQTYATWQEYFAQRPGMIAVLSTLVVVAALVLTLIVAWRRREAQLAGAGAVALALMLAAAQDAASTPSGTAVTVGYTLRWLSPAGMCIWLMVGWSLGTTVSRRFLERDLRPRLQWVGVLAVTIAGVLVASTVSYSRSPFREMRGLADRVVPNVSSNRAVRVEAELSKNAFSATTFVAADFHAGLVWRLRRAGRTVVLDPGFARGYGPQYAVGSARTTLRVYVNHSGPKAGRVLASVSIPDPYGQRTRDLVTVTRSSR